MKTLSASAVVLARFLISAVFLASGMGKLFHWQEQERNFVQVLSEWQSYPFLSEDLQNLFAMAISWAPLLLILGTVFEFLGGLLVLLGIRERLGAFLLIAFLLPTTILMHPFWFFEGSVRELQSVHFLKNLAILGGLLLILRHGAQANAEKSSFPSLPLG